MHSRSTGALFHYFAPVVVRTIAMSTSVCLSVRSRTAETTAKLREIFCTCYGGLWLGRPLTKIVYVIYNYVVHGVTFSQSKRSHVIYCINDRKLSVTEVRALYGRLNCGWLRVVCAWRDTLRWEVGMAGWARSLHGKKLLGATGGAHRLRAF